MIAEKSTRSDDAIEALVARAHAAGVLRPDVTSVDLSLLIEQLSKSPLLEQLKKQGRDDLTDAAASARMRITAVVLDGLRPGARDPLPGPPPPIELFTERWAPPLTT